MEVGERGIHTKKLLYRFRREKRTMVRNRRGDSRCGDGTPRRAGQAGGGFAYSGIGLIKLSLTLPSVAHGPSVSFPFSSRFSLFSGGETPPLQISLYGVMRPLAANASPVGVLVRPARISFSQVVRGWSSTLFQWLINHTRSGAAEKNCGC